ncbi:MAG: hypothetical protein JSU87_02975 [Gemmatimonadota bacterium]|nr:MAG: hypothetical protein JSU87_02975 [Gemmatimonadota bacterium]
MTPASDRHVALRLAFVVAAALLVRGLFVWLRGEYLDWDEAMYLLIARSFLEGGGPQLNGLPHTALGPFVPLASAAVARLTGLELLVAQRAISALAGAGLIVPVFHLLRHEASDRVAWTAVSLLVAWPALIDVAPKLGPMWLHMYAGTEPTYLFFLFAALACGEWALRRRGPSAWILAWVAGSLMACAYLTRAEAVVLAGFYVVVRGIQWVRARGDARGLTVPSLAVLAFLVTSGPHLYYLRQVGGEWMLSGQPATMRPMVETLQGVFRSDAYIPNLVRAWWRLDGGHGYFQNPYWGTPEGVSRAEQGSEFARLAAAETPVQRGWWDRLGNRLRNFGYALWTLCGLLFGPFVVVGILTARKRALPVFILAGFGASLAVSLYLAALPRFFLYLVPALALWAAYGILAVADRLPRFRELTTRCLVGALVLASLVVVGRRSMGDLAQSLFIVADEDRWAGEALSAALPDADRVIHWHPRFAYWAGWEWRTMPYASLDDIAHYAVTQDAKHVLLARGGFSPVSAEVSLILVIVDEALLDVLRAADRGERHSHPSMLLSEVSPVAGYATGVLGLDQQPSEDAGQVE